MKTDTEGAYAKNYKKPNTKPLPLPLMVIEVSEFSHLVIFSLLAFNYKQVPSRVC